MIRSRKVVVVGIFLLTVVLAQVSFAAESLMGDPEDPVKLASTKLWRGVVNTFTGIGEIVRQPIVCTKTDGIAGVPAGLINGFFMSFVRTGAGIFEVFTFPMPFDYEIGYDSIMNPDYVWQKAD